MRRGRLTNAPNKHRIALPFGAERTEARAITGGVETFLELNDTPHEYKAEAGKWVRVKDDEKGLEFIHPNLGLSYTITLTTIMLMLLAAATFNNSLGHIEVETLANPSFQNTTLMPKDIETLANPSFQNTSLLGKDITTLANPTVVDLSIA